MAVAGVLSDCATVARRRRAGLSAPPKRVPAKARRIFILVWNFYGMEFHMIGQRRAKEAGAVNGRFCIGFLSWCWLPEDLSGPSGNFFFLSTRQSLTPSLLRHPLGNGDFGR